MWVCRNPAVWHTQWKWHSCDCHAEHNIVQFQIRILRTRRQNFQRPQECQHHTHSTKALHKECIHIFQFCIHLFFRFVMKNANWWPLLLIDNPPKFFWHVKFRLKQARHHMHPLQLLSLPKLWSKDVTHLQKGTLKVCSMECFDISWLVLHSEWAMAAAVSHWWSPPGRHEGVFRISMVMSHQTKSVIPPCWPAVKMSSLIFFELDPNKSHENTLDCCSTASMTMLFSLVSCIWEQVFALRHFSPANGFFVLQSDTWPTSKRPCESCWSILTGMCENPCAQVTLSLMLKKFSVTLSSWLRGFHG